MKQEPIAGTSSSEASEAVRTELFNRYVLPHKNLIYALCIRYTFRREDIADNYNDVLVNFFRYIHTYKPERSIQTWLHIVTKRYVYDLNLRRRLPTTDDVSIYDLPAGALSGEDTHTNSMGMDNYREFYNDDILRALGQLKPIYREALLLQQAGYKLHEIMEITFRNGTLKSRNIETVKSRLFLAKQQLRELITRDGEHKPQQ